MLIEERIRKQNHCNLENGSKVYSEKDETISLYTIKAKLTIKIETLSLDGEKLILVVGAECCFVHETFLPSRGNLAPLSALHLTSICILTFAYVANKNI